ncbi:hypothetical protein BJY01DRAFT_184242 [Aspergillus pseudoustus]|uniref:Uncharacterized protein n=1 Tax=Aspergillus pseudoustus TaxID=1810923 RepID=A0ABR4JYA3_9EURO
MNCIFLRNPPRRSRADQAGGSKPRRPRRPKGKASTRIPSQLRKSKKQHGQAHDSTTHATAEMNADNEPHVAQDEAPAARAAWNLPLSDTTTSHQRPAVGTDEQERTEPTNNDYEEDANHPDANESTLPEIVNFNENLDIGWYTSFARWAKPIVLCGARIHTPGWRVLVEHQKNQRYVLGALRGRRHRNAIFQPEVGFKVL